MSTVLLRLEGALQSWGTESRFGHRDTQREPSKSGVLGLVGAALGMPRDDDARLARLATGRMAVRVDREGDTLADYHTAGGGTFRGQDHSVHGAKDTVLTRRHYLSSASFLVAITYTDAALAHEIHAALGAPHWPLTLGRRACPPSVPVQAGLVDASAEQALRAAAYPAPRPPRDDVRLVVECSPDDDGAEPRQDQPVSFRLHHRSFARRWIKTTWIARDALTLAASDAPSVSLVALAGGA